MTQLQYQVNDLTKSKERLERLLAEADPSFRRQQSEFWGTADELVKLLPKNVAIIDFVKTRAWRRDSAGKIQTKPELIYEAFVLRSAHHPGDEEYSRVEIGDAKQIDNAIDEWRLQVYGKETDDRGVKRKDLRPFVDARKSTEILTNLIWKKLESKVQDIDTCVVIPEGAIASIPFAALSGTRPGTYLAEEKGFVTVAFAQQVLMRLKESPHEASDTSEALIMGGIVYDASRDSAVPQDGERGYRSPSSADQKRVWSFLPGTVDEASEIRRLWNGKVDYLSGPNATKSALLERIRNCRYVHLATHGFFSAEPVESVLSVRGQLTTLNGLPFRKKNLPGQLNVPLLFESLVGRNPMVLSGIVLAGANIPEQNGILTAEELVDLDLKSTELVTLSACETGLGAPGGGEGVFGLQLAIALAGARASLATLWRVDDTATKSLMIEFIKICGIDV